MTTFRYELVVERPDDGDGPCTARLEGQPLSGVGSTPLEAVRMLCEAIAEWPRTGADQWMKTPKGRELFKLFGVPPMKGERNES